MMIPLCFHWALLKEVLVIIVMMIDYEKWLVLGQGDWQGNLILLMTCMRSKFWQYYHTNLISILYGLVLGDILSSNEWYMVYAQGIGNLSMSWHRGRPIHTTIFFLPRIPHENHMSTQAYIHWRRNKRGRSNHSDSLYSSFNSFPRVPNSYNFNVLMKDVCLVSTFV